MTGLQLWVWAPSSMARTMRRAALDLGERPLGGKSLTLGGSGEVAHLRIERIDGPLRATPGANALQHDCHVSLHSKAILALCGERDPLAIHLSAADPSLGNGDAHERIGIYRIGILFKDRQIGKFARL